MKENEPKKIRPKMHQKSKLYKPILLYKLTKIIIGKIFEIASTVSAVRNSDLLSLQVLE